MSTLDIGQLGAVLKTKYTQRKYNLLSYKNNPFFALVRKDTTFGGNNKLIGLRNAVPSGVSSDFASALASVGPSTYSGFTVTRNKAYALAQISGEAISAGKGNENSLLDVLTKEIDGAVHAATRHVAIMAMRNGGGARGQISSGSNVQTNTITLANINDVTNFDLNQVVQLSADDGTGGAGVRTNTVTITKIDRQAGTLVANAAWNTVTSAAANDYIFVKGDYNNVIKGTAAWCPTTAPSSTAFFGLDRSTDPTRLAGVTYTGGGAPIEETLIEVAWRIDREGGMPDYVFLNPRDYSPLVKSIGSKVIYDRVQTVDTPEIGFDAVKLQGPNGAIRVIADLNQPQGSGTMVQLDTWAVESSGGAPRILDEDGQTILRDPNTDSYIVRIGGYLQLTNEAPGYNSTFTL